LANVWFPLTPTVAKPLVGRPALSLGERENDFPDLEAAGTFRLVHRRAVWPPLPKEEGRGEGKGLPGSAV